MADRIELNLEEVRRQAKIIRQAGGTVHEAGKSLEGGTRSDPNFFEKDVEKALNSYVQMIRQFGEGYQQSMIQYAQRLDNAADIFEQAEDSQLEIISSVRNAVVAAPSGAFSGHEAAQRPISRFAMADDLSADGTIPPVPLPPSVHA